MLRVTPFASTSACSRISANRRSLPTLAAHLMQLSHTFIPCAQPFTTPITSAVHHAALLLHLPPKAHAYRFYAAPYAVGVSSRHCRVLARRRHLYLLAPLSAVAHALPLRCAPLITQHHYCPLASRAPLPCTNCTPTPPTNPPASPLPRSNFHRRSYASASPAASWCTITTRTARRIPVRPNAFNTYASVTSRSFVLLHLIV